jgi:hypothetical protein
VRSDVVIVGYRLNAKEPAAKALERILKLAPDEARRVARSFPARVASGLPNERAEALAEALRDAGAQVQLEAHANEPTTEPPAERIARAVATQLPVPSQVSRRAEASDTSGSYRLGDFEPSVVAKLPTEESAPRPAPSRSPGEELALDFPLGADLGIGLDLDVPARGGSRDMPLAASAAEHNTLDGFDDFEPAAKLPVVEEQAFRAVQHRPRAPEPRRSLPPSATQRIKRAVGRGVLAWLPSLAMLATLSAGSVFAVGYALDPGDAVGAIRREAADRAFAATLPGTAAEGPREKLHPLLRAAPQAIRSPLAAILRARLGGVHALPLSFDSGGGHADCILVERAVLRDNPGPLFETGQRVEPPGDILQQLREHQRAFRASTRDGDVEPLCLRP